jgi:hypothetical protein
MSTMTFEQFQATRTYCDDLGAKLKDGRWEGGPNGKGNVYVDSLYIEDVSDNRNMHANWYLELGHAEGGLCDDLAALEHKLYDWAVSAGYCDDAPANKTQAEWQTAQARIMRDALETIARWPFDEHTEPREMAKAIVAMQAIALTALTGHKR